MTIPTGLTDQTKLYIILILDALRKVGVLHIRGLAKYLSKATGKEVNPNTVLRIVNNYLKYTVDIERVEQVGSAVKVVRFKPGKENAQLQDVMKYILVKKRIRSQE